MQSQTICVSAADAARSLSISERKFHELRKHPGFPQPRQVGNRHRWLVSELLAYLERQPPAAPLPEPAQLSGSLKGRIAPVPESWPVAPSASEALRTPAAGGDHDR